MRQEKREAVITIIDRVSDGVPPFERRVVPLDENGRIELDEDVYVEESVEGGIRYFAPGLPDEGALGRTFNSPLGSEGVRSYTVEIRDRSEG